MRLRLAAARSFITAAAWLLVACPSHADAGGGGHGEGAPAAAAPPTADAATSSSTTTAGETTLTIASGGATRTATVVVPQGMASRPPLVLLFHGSGGTSEGMLQTTGLAVTAAAHGVLLVAPQAIIRSATGGPFWNVPGVPLTDGSALPAGAPSDVDFVRALIDALTARYGVDPHRIFAAGFSGGARFTSTLACAVGDRIAAVATASGLRFPDGCAPPRAVSVLAFHALDDGTNPYDGGPPPAYWLYGVDEAARRWAHQDGCPSSPAVTPAGDGVTSKKWDGCEGGAAVELLVRRTGGHAWPAPSDGANERMVEFFAAHARK